MRAMLKLGLRSLTAHKLRVALTTFAVLLGVSFVVASFVLSDGLRRTFDNIVTDANAAVDVEVRAAEEFEEVQFTMRRIDESVAGVDGVGDLVAGAQSFKAVPVKSDGEPITTFGPPIFAINWTEFGDTLHIVEGSAPSGPGEFALDETSAADHGFVVGRTYDMIGVDGREPARRDGKRIEVWAEVPVHFSKRPRPCIS